MSRSPGTFNNNFHYDGTGLRVDGKVQSGAGSKVTLTGSSTQGAYPTGGLFSGSGTGLFTGLLSEIVAGTGGLDVTGTVDSSFPSTNLTGASLNGAATSAGNIAVTGTSLAYHRLRGQGPLPWGGTLAATGAATITLTGSGVTSSGDRLFL
jgi:polygalacturonase